MPGMRRALQYLLWQRMRVSLALRYTRAHSFYTRPNGKGILMNRRQFVQYGKAAVVGGFGSTLLGCRNSSHQEPTVQSVNGLVTLQQPSTGLTAQQPKVVRLDAKEFPHAGDETTSWVNPADHSKLYGLVNPTLTLVKETDTGGNLTFYATMTWTYHSYGWKTDYKSPAPNLPPDIAIKFVHIDSAGHVGFPYRWDIGKLQLLCPTPPDAYFKTAIEPDLYDITMNWWPDFSEARFYVC